MQQQEQEKQRQTEEQKEQNKFRMRSHLVTLLLNEPPVNLQDYVKTALDALRKPKRQGLARDLDYEESRDRLRKELELKIGTLRIPAAQLETVQVSSRVGFLAISLMSLQEILHPLPIQPWQSHYGRNQQG
jgi:hypothetical protein